MKRIHIMPAYMHKIRTLEEMKEARERLKAEGKSVVFTNGCFDLLHPGHVRYLAEARDLGNFMIVAVNSDRSVREIKGPGRPIQDEKARTEVLAALSAVDGVLIFDEDNPLRVIEALLPDILVKGGDWEEDRIIGSHAVKAAGGEVRRIRFLEGFSTTGIIQKILDNPA